MNKHIPTWTFLVLSTLLAVGHLDAQEICLSPEKLGQIIAGACSGETPSGESDDLPADLFDLPSSEDLSSPLAADLFSLILAQQGPETEAHLRRRWAGCSEPEVEGWSLPVPYCYRIYLPRQLFHAVEMNPDAVASGSEWSEVADAAFLAELHRRMQSRPPRVESVPDGEGGKILVIKSSSRLVSAVVGWLEDAGELAALDLKSYLSSAQLSGSLTSGASVEPRSEVAKEWRRAEKHLASLLELYDSEATAGLRVAAEVLRDVAESTESEQDDELALLLESLFQN